MFSKIFRPLLRPILTPRPIFPFSQKRPIIQMPAQQQQRQQYRQKRSAYLNIALTCFVFAACFAGIPLYRTFCEHMGLVGDVDKKQYTFVGQKLNNLKKFKVNFTGACDPDINWEFEPVQRELVVSAGETAIVFYRLYNKEERGIVGFATYNISPEDCNVYFSKIQCFCFNQQLINPKEELLLPIFFYLEPEINDDQMVSRATDIKISYSFTKSAKQDLAKFAADEQKRIEENKRKLNEIRARKMNMSIEEYSRHLEEKQEAEEREEAKARDQLERAQRQREKDMLRQESGFEEDLIKAQLISKEFEEEVFSAAPIRTTPTPRTASVA